MIGKLLILIPALPLASAVLTAVLGPKLLRSRAHWPTLIALGGSFLMSLMLLLEVNHKLPNASESDSSQPHASESAAAGGEEGIGWFQTVTLWTWLDIDDALQVDGATSERNFSIDITLRADPLTAIMLAMVTFIATLVAIYSVGYMQGDSGYWRFFAYVSLFVFSMTMLVSVSNFLLLYVFWEAVGLCSYLLIGFWYQKPEASAAGKKAFLVNRVGDFGFALGLFLIWTTYGSLNFHDTDAAGQPLPLGSAAIQDASEGTPGVLGQTRLASGDFVGASDDSSQHEKTLATAICLLLLIGACGKSAQFPLHVWLPDAMEGPTPVSALIHAATMVTAGVYMITRCSPLFMASIDAQLVVAVIGGFTALLAGLIAMTQTDLKRVMAYSTVSQLGYMFLSLGTGTYIGIIAGMFHLFTHAFFKSLLFLGSGSVMHAMGGVIDFRKFGGLRHLMPITFWTFLCGCLALSGVVPFAGFFSKDAIIAAVYDRGLGDGQYAVWFEWLAYVGFFTALLTAIYSFRAFFRTFFGDLRVPPEAGHHAHESPWAMACPLLILGACTILVGFFDTGIDRLLGNTPSLAAPIVHNSVAVAAHLPVVEGEEHHGSHALVSTVSTILAGLGIALSAFLYLGHRREAEVLARIIRPAYVLSHGKFFLDQIYYALIVLPLLGLAHVCYAIDRWLIDGLVNLIGRVPPVVGSFLRGTQAGLVPLYATFMVLGLLALAGVLYFV